MNKVLALAAAALLVTAGGALAAKVKTTTTNLTLSIFGLSCTAHVNVFNDPKDGITSQVLVTANESDGCETFTGEGYVSKLTVAKGDTRTVAVIGGKSNQFASPVTITLDYPFVTGGQYTLSTTDGHTITGLAAGSYTVAP